MLSYLRFKGQKGVQEGLIRARDFATAEKVGRRYCEQHSARFMLCWPALLADESILALPATAPPVDPEPLEKPSLEEQRERIKNRGRAQPSEDDEVDVQSAADETAGSEGEHDGNIAPPSNVPPPAADTRATRSRSNPGRIGA